MGGESMLEEAGVLLPDYIIHGDQTTLTIMVTALVVACLAVIVLLFAFIRMRRKVLGQQVGVKPRFRKRDKVLFYGRKIIRKVRSFSGPVHSSMRRSVAMRRKNSKDYINLAKSIKNILQSSDSNKPVLKIKEPPPAILEADIHESQMPPELRIPPEVLYMLKNIRVFGHFEKPLFLELCRSVETKFIPAGAYLFKRGQPDDCIYVVQSGRLVVYINEPDGAEFEVKEVTQGDSVHSLLSILDVITGYPALYKTVSAKAAVDTTVLLLPAKAFQSVFERFPESLVRVVQMIMVRLQRVTFQTLHALLGLNVELINTEDTSDRSLAIHGVYSRGSPTKPGNGPPSSHSSSTIGSSSSVDGVSKVLQFDEDPKNTTRLVLSERSSAEDSDLDMRARTDSSSSGLKKQGMYQHKSSSLEVDTSGRLAMSMSDFEVAAGRARVHGLEESKKETHKQGHEESSKPTKRVTIAEDHQYTHDRKRHVSGDVAYTDDEILKMAKEDLVGLLGLDDASLLDAHINLAHIPAGGIVVKEGDQEASLLFIVTGTLLMSQTIVDSEDDKIIFTAYPGEFVGELAVLTGEPALFTVKARQDCRVIAISKTSFYSIMKECPQVVLRVGHYVVRKLSPFVRQTDFALDWMQLDAGKAVYRQGDPSDCTYIVLNGRLRSVVQQASGKKELMGEYGRGEIVGVVEVLTMTDRITTVHAIRDTELAKLPSGMLSLIKRKFPEVVTRLIQILGQRLLGQVQEKAGASALSDLHATTENLSTVTVIPISDDVPLDRFCCELTHAIRGIGSVLRLTSEHVLQTLGGSALDSIHEYRLTSWLGQQEDLNRIVLYQADKRMTTWTQRCIRQADCILIVGRSDHDPEVVGRMEKQLENLAVRAQKELIILHKEKEGVYQAPTRTAEWLNARDWCVSHHHIRCPKRMFTKRSPARVREMYDKLFTKTPDKHCDFGRLARFLTGTSIGLILGGGGARGMSQIGIIKAMEEHSIPIDMVGGVSIGAFNGAIFCEELNSSAMEPRAYGWCREMGSLWKKVLDLTYPITAMFSGRGFNNSIRDVFQDKQIEDLWIPYFCITTDITHSKMRVHTNGSLWRYVRASMSLSGYLPPLCDPKDGHLLLDGGYVNNLPADVMKAYGAQTIIAVDVGSEDDTQLTNYGDDLSGWWLLWKRWNPWASAIRVPDLNEIQSRLAYVSCCKQLEEVKNSTYCEYIRPPIDRYKTLMFHKYAEIRDIGYHHGITVFQGWERAGYTGEILREKAHVHKKIQSQKAHPTFTDLAAMVSRIGQTKRSLSDRDDDDFGGLHLSNSNDSFFANQSQSEGEEILESDDDEMPPTPCTDGLRQRRVLKTEDSIETCEEGDDEEEQD